MPLMHIHFNYQLYILRALYIATFGYCFAIPVMVPYINDTLGNAGYYFYLASLSAIASLLLSIPFGILADKWGRKNSIVLGLTLDVIGWSSLAFATTLTGFVAFFVISGIAGALLSSSTSAYLLDLLEHNDSKDNYQAEESKKGTYGIPIIAGITLFSGLIYALNPQLPFIINSAFYMLMLLLVLFLLPSLKISNSTKIENTCQLPFSTMKKLLAPNKKLLWLLITCGTWTAILSYTIFAFQTHYLDIGASEVFIAITISSIYFLRASGAWLTQKYNSPKYTTLMALMTIALILASAYSANIWILTILLLAFSMTREFTSTIARTLITHESPRQHRSVVKSISNSLGTTISIIVNALSGWVILNWQGQGVLLLHALFLLSICGVSWILYLHLSKQKHHNL